MTLLAGLRIEDWESGERVRGKGNSLGNKYLVSRKVQASEPFKDQADPKCLVVAERSMVSFRSWCSNFGVAGISCGSPAREAGGQKGVINERGEGGRNRYS